MTGILQGCLLAMGITFELRARRRNVAGDGGVVDSGYGHDGEANGTVHEHTREENHERTALLGNER